ncbi:MAG: ADP-glyceromanno-heptose 6-epimerase [Cyclobacteriaceae bacterium]
MIVVTGAAGFIGSSMIRKLNDENFNDIVAVDSFTDTRKEGNLRDKKIRVRIDRNQFFDWIDKNHEQVEFIFHLGARTDTTELDVDLLDQLNTTYSKQVWTKCVDHQIPLVYASSAATYGAGEQGFSDNEANINQFKPLNPYGNSKQAFDTWALEQDHSPFFWAGLKFFNVYGPNEYHKGRMASVIFHCYHQIKDKASMQLFRSHRPDYSNGGQLRDFIYVKDVTDTLYWLMHHRRDNGIYNLGTGRARSFLDLAGLVFANLNAPQRISFIDIPIDIREKYQYYTEADMGKLRSIGYERPFTELEQGIADYVSNHLLPNKYY